MRLTVYRRNDVLGYRHIDTLPTVLYCVLAGAVHELIAQVGAFQGGENAPDPEHSEISVTNIAFSGEKGGWRSEVQLTLSNADGKRLTNGGYPVRADVWRISGMGGVHVEEPLDVLVVDAGDGTVSVAFTALSQGSFKVRVTLYAREVTGSPLTITVDGGPSLLLWGVDRGVVLGCSSVFETDLGYDPENLRTNDTSTSWLANSGGHEFVEFGELRLHVSREPSPARVVDPRLWPLRCMS